jgi:uncharacterized caspase-like protein
MSGHLLFGGFRVWDSITGRLLHILAEPAAELEPLQFAYTADGHIIYWGPEKQSAMKSHAAPCPAAAPASAAVRVFSIGISEYSDARSNLPAARSDAVKIADLLVSRAHESFRVAAPIKLYDRAATRDGIEAGFARLARESHPEDVAVIFFAGHGVDHGKDFYLVPSDASPAAAETSGISTVALAKALARVPARKKLFIVDACQSGGALSKLAAAISKTPGTSMYFLVSSLGSEMETRRLGHGILTHALLKSIGSEPLTAALLMQKVAKEIPLVSAKYFPARPQRATVLNQGEDFPLLGGIK